jgi:hypothetical protein
MRRALPGLVWNSYRQNETGGYDVVGQRLDTFGVPLGPEFRVNSYTTGSQYHAAVAADKNGNFIVVWSSYQVGSGVDEFGQRYNAAGAPQGGEFRLNSYTGGDALLRPVRVVPPGLHGAGIGGTRA